MHNVQGFSQIFHRERFSWEIGWRMYSGSLCVSCMCQHLTASVKFVGQFDFVEEHRGLHPVRTEVGRVGVDVDAAVTVRLRFARRDPLAVHVLPAVPVCRAEVQQERIHGVGIQTRHADLQDWKHSPTKGQNNTFWISKKLVFRAGNKTKVIGFYLQENTISV